MNIENRQAAAKTRAISTRTNIENAQVQYRGETWPSLSAVAREITGTRWSGPRFFGLGREDRGGGG